MSSFNDLIFPVNASDKTLDSQRNNVTIPRQPGVFPQQVNTNGSARATATFAIDDEVYTAVCVSEADGVSLGGGVDIARWRNGTFEIVQARTDDPSASAVAFLKAVDSKGESHSYIAVANSWHEKLRTLSSTQTALRVYRYVCMYVCMNWCACEHAGCAECAHLSTYVRVSWLCTISYFAPPDCVCTYIYLNPQLVDHLRTRHTHAHTNTPTHIHAYKHTNTNVVGTPMYIDIYIYTHKKKTMHTYTHTHTRTHV
jgi:hypothetical protein